MTSSIDVSTAPAEQPASRRGVALRPLVRRLHFYAGLLVAPFLLVAATTGLLYAASFQIEKIVYQHELTAPVGQTRLPLDQQVAAASAALPDGKVSAVRPGTEAGQTTRVLLDVPGLAPSTRMAVFVDPYTAQVRGTLESYGSSGALPVRAWISNLHRHLHLGEPGRIYSELAASWLWVVALGGLLLWLTRRRRQRRRLILPERGAPAARRTLSWHGSVGVWAVLGLLFLSATGLTWSKYAGANIGDLRSAWGWGTPAIDTSGGEHAAHSSGGHQHGATSTFSLDRVAQAGASKGLSGPLEITWPAEAGGPYLVKEIDNQWPVRLDQVAVSTTTGQVSAELRFDDYPLAAKLTSWGISAHMGTLFGLANQIALMAVAAGLITLIVLGYRMWWQHRPASTPARGAWRQAGWAATGLLALVAVGIGVFLPLMGIPLVAFLLLDAVLGWRSRSVKAR
ncbi:PepSY-associated TM helix domain-containing protein [Nonomuraea rubra]|uniref:Putative iron-regulated membrane protein n=1 Tax=Nonomuraea rubra TaxID=46180 RepID=A0A7X0P0X4_9ACTN|nr:PepSY domain-containing protein [Nonomuraea rubra]MBB6553235.1 putative iron-regulated membrane protein [Nonomuraea rubra]